MINRNNIVRDKSQQYGKESGMHQLGSNRFPALYHRGAKDQHCHYNAAANEGCAGEQAEEEQQPDQKFCNGQGEAERYYQPPGQHGVLKAFYHPGAEPAELGQPYQAVTKHAGARRQPEQKEYDSVVFHKISFLNKTNTSCKMGNIDRA